MRVRAGWTVVAWLALAAAGARGQTTLVADAHVSAARPAVNAGTLTNLNVGGGYTALVQFDLSMLPAGTTPAQVTRALLRVYCNRADTAGVVAVQPVGGAWGEYSLTYATLPSLGAAVQTAQVPGADTFVTFDVTATVQGWVSGSAKNNGLALTAGTAVLQFDSKENDETGHAPELQIVLAAGGVGTQGPVGATGATGAVGATGPAGPAGASGAVGPVGPQGVAGPAGVAGARGATGATGPAGPQGLPGVAGATMSLNFRGVYSSIENYAVSDVVTFAGSSYASVGARNHGNTPGLTPDWALLAQAGAAGPVGAAGAAGAAGATGAQGPVGVGVAGPVGPTGATGPAGLPGLVYRGVYVSGTNYALGDVVVFGGSSYASLMAGNHGNTPGLSADAWGLLTAQGPQGVAGAAGLVGAAGPAGPLGPVGPPGERGDQGFQGIAGQAGAQGLTGSSGADGLQGPAGPQGVQGPVGLAFKGVYDSSANYGLGDGVQWKGAGWVSVVSGNHGNTPDVSPGAWLMFATGTAGVAGPMGVAGVDGAAGAQGLQGMTGAQGPVGAMGPQGPAVVNYMGNYVSGTSYGVADAVSFGGSTYVGLVGNNHGNTPGLSPEYWAVLAGRGADGAAGPAGVAGSAGMAGPAGTMGPSGVQGPPVAFAGIWDAGRSYAVGDAVSFGGASYIAVVANSGRQPDLSLGVWGILSARGAQGAVGAQGVSGEPGVRGDKGDQGLQGLPGQAGAQGVAGVQGPQGATGSVGPQGVAGPVGMSFRGGYDATANYGIGDGVQWNGAGYVSVAAVNHGNTPDTSPLFWQVFATGTAGAAGAEGQPGKDGSPGVAGAQGLPGAQGPSGPVGPVGPAVVNYVGNYVSGTSYGVADAVSFGGSTYVSLVGNNHGNTPDVSTAYWAVLAGRGVDGAAGAQGVQGVAGPAGATGLAGPAGAQGPPVVFAGGWDSARAYAVGDAVSFGGSSYIAVTASRGAQPDVSASLWGVLAARGAQGAGGAQGLTGLQGVQGERGVAGPQGVAGAAGAEGVAGPVGPAGLQGPAGMQGAVGAMGLRFQGAYQSSVNYAAGDGVLWQGAGWVSRVDANHGNTPDLSPGAWSLFAAAGTAGVDGAVGPAGAEGLAGPQGPVGAAGSQGLAGPAGASGAKGDKGDAGPQGVAGGAGPAGLTGPAGATGAQGPAGVQGAAGAVGLSFQGAYSSVVNYAVGDGVLWQGAGWVSLVAGNHGNTPDLSPGAWGMFSAPGATGASGAKGDKGDAGPQGLTGVAGAVGAAGTAGPAGANGARGDAGPQGLKGDPGVQGPAGTQGLAGPTGAKGDKGDAGAQGLAGQAGAQGLPGTAGPQGLQGPAGAKGDAGAVGLAFRGVYDSSVNYGVGDGVLWQGAGWVSKVEGNLGNVPDQSPGAWLMFSAPGAAGATGPQGVMGVPGPAGPQGLAGAIGAAGAVGPAGAAGASGPAGAQGAKGDVGTQGPAGAQGLIGPAGAKGDKGDAGAQGLAGQAGAQGLTGPVGAQGLQGPAGAQGAVGAVGLVFQGGYDSTATYAAGDGVLWQGAGWVSKMAGNRGNTPDQSPGFWTMFAAAGLQGATGPQGVMGAAGAEGAQGLTGPVGPAGAAGTAGAVGAQGAQGLQGVKGDAGVQGPVGTQGLQGVTGAKGDKGDTGLQGVAGQAGAQGIPGATGGTGPQGVAGPQGPTGPSGANGAQGSPGVAGAVGVNFRGGWDAGTNYAVNDGVTFGGSTYLAQAATRNVQPDSSAQSWAVLAQAGGAGPTGAAGTGATVSVGTVTTLAAGAPATVTNSGTVGAAVLNFGLPQGAAGAGGGSGTGTSAGGGMFAAMYHTVSFSTAFYAVNTASAAASETATVLAWVPRACSAVRLDVFSQQSNTVTVTLRNGVPGSMTNTALSCAAATGGSCSVTGSVAIAAGSFIDLGIAGPSGTPAGVWTSLECD